MPNGRPASTTNPDTWSSWQEVQQGAGDGFGVVVGGGLAVYDLDACLDGGVLADWAREVIAGIREPVLFCEVSMSGRGLHVFVEAVEGRGYRRGGVEFYSWGRFVRMTLQAYPLEGAGGVPVSPVAS